MKEIPMTAAREELTALPERLSETHETVTVTRRGKPVLAILPWEEYEAIVETLEILSDEDLMSSLRQGIKEAKQGKTIPWEQAKRKLGL
jgi:prevent-host-death family protein